MKRSKKPVWATLLFVLGWQTTSLAEEHRYISIRNTDSVWVQGVCSLVFRLDNGGAGEFGPLEVNIELNDKTGNVLEKGTLNVAPFGDSDATRSIDAATEFDCEAVEKASNIRIVEVTEVRGNSTKVALPVTTFDPQYYKPLKISISP
ncbi:MULTISPECIES: IrmA family protein [unclassified Pantoea]|uniref:IrmA family protein n=1 Tax=unclassified Pantoea TaxID=2630326 RepID=UPI001CD40615|nr:MULTISPECIES: IrmA family protein [unclassified Pantoea]MCA1178737.1 hypothetical protein [Pantoea sp. alder69]MCA1251098.1 hypothetical protein [Pantoea sp. alder70]MCA1267226.1 hypothetical protein [Pantoea sp. alder81]